MHYPNIQMNKMVARPIKFLFLSLCLLGIGISSYFNHSASVNAQGPIRFPIPTIESSLLPSRFAVPASPPVSTFDVTRTSTIGDNPETFIDSATDGNGNQLFNSANPTTTSTAITFSFHGVQNPSTQVPVVGFQCSLDGSSLTSCGSTNNNFGTVSYSGLESGIGHTFKVSAVDRDGNTDQFPASFSWTISTSSAAVIPQINGTSDNSLAAAQAFSNTVQNIANQKAAQKAAATAAISVATIGVLNPPFKPCDNNDDLAIYNIYGDANLQNLLHKTSPLAPISLLIYLDSIPADALNLIINNNSVYLKGVLVIYPGDTNNQESTPFRVTKILTECKHTTLIDKAEALGGPSKGAAKPSVAKPVGNLPPFETCKTPQGATSFPAAISPGQQAGSSSPITFPQRQALSLLQNNNNLTAIDKSLTVAATTPTTDQAPLGGFQSSTGTSGAAPAVAPASGGVDPDLVKYTVRGTIDTTKINQVSGKQSIVIKIFNDPNKGTLGALQTVRVFDSNNQYAATFQVNPIEGSARWIPLNFVLHELSTSCGQAAFVDRPMEIGVDAADYSTQPRDKGFNP